MKKADHQTPRERIARFQQIVNVGPAVERDLRLLGYRQPPDLIGEDPLVMFEELCRRTNSRQDPCVLDVFMAVTDFMNGNPPCNWWDFTAERKQRYSQRIAASHA